MTGRSSIAPTDSSLSLRRSLVIRTFQMLNTRQGDFAVTALGALCCFGNPLRVQNTAGRADGAVAVIRRVVAMAGAAAEPTSISHDE
jgi:hypothetical protein